MIEGRVLGVLTGDIVDSSRLRMAGLGPIFELIDNTGNWIKNHFQDAIHAQIDVFRGDSWQMVVLEPAYAFRIGLLFRALMRYQYGIDSRVSVGFGPVDYLPNERLPRSMSRRLPAAPECQYLPSQYDQQGQMRSDDAPYAGVRQGVRYSSLLFAKSSFSPPYLLYKK